MTAPEPEPAPEAVPVPAPDAAPAVDPPPEAEAAPAPGYTPPALPPVRTGLWAIAIPGMALWLTGFIVLLFFIPQLQANDAMVWLWTCLSGFVLGIIGLSIYLWQRSAARRGTRTASAMALDERF